MPHHKRMIVAAFAYLNGLHEEYFLDWATLYGMAGNKDAEREFKYIFRAFRQGKHYNLYAWIVSRNRYEYFDGRIRYYQNKADREEQQKHM